MAKPIGANRQSIQGSLRLLCAPGKRLLAGAIIGWVVVAGAGCQRQSARFTDTSPKTVVIGHVVSRGQPVDAARVRIKGQGDYVLTDDTGQFRLELPAADVSTPKTVTAAKPGFLIAGATAAHGMEIELPRLPEQDHEDYAWVDPTPDPQQSQNCGNCHREIFAQWHAGGHARAATNRHFLSLYDAATWDTSQQKGWSLIDEYPEAAGVCLACHAPAATIDELAVADIRAVAGVVRHGVHCDFCHKVQDVELSATGLTHGRFATRLLRPAESSRQLFFGPLDDVDRGEDIFLPLQQESRFCASCHEGVVFGVPVYTTYSEWMQSPARTAGKQCQTCHMAPNGQMTNIAPGFGGVERDPMTLASHELMPGGQSEMLRRCLKVTTASDRQGQGLNLTVQVVAQDVGHHVPTGFIDRHLMLVVQASDPQGIAVPLHSGPRLPQAAADLADQPGVLWAKRLIADDDNSPQPFWRAGGRIEDNRLRPEIPQSFAFRWSGDVATVRVRLLYRSFWMSVAQEKQWPDPTLVVLEKKL